MRPRAGPEPAGSEPTAQRACHRHPGITTGLLRNLLNEDALRPQLLAARIPPCAITTIDDLTVVTIASTAHLS